MLADGEPVGFLACKLGVYDEAYALLGGFIGSLHPDARGVGHVVGEKLCVALHVLVACRAGDRSGGGDDERLVLALSHGKRLWHDVVVGAADAGVDVGGYDSQQRH